MAQILYGVEITAIFALSLLFSCLGLVALGKFAVGLTQMLRGDVFNRPSPDDVGSYGLWRRGGFKSVARLLALLLAAALLFGLSYALARWTMAPLR